jgi:hypothetical protein
MIAEWRKCFQYNFATVAIGRAMARKYGNLDNLPLSGNGEVLAAQPLNGVAANICLNALYNLYRPNPLANTANSLDTANEFSCRIVANHILLG